MGTNQLTTTNLTFVDKSYAQITKSSSEENTPQPLDTNNNKISENLKNTIEFTKKSEERLNNTTQEIIQHVEKEKDSIDQKLKHSTTQLETFYKDHKQAMEKINVQEKQIHSIAHVVEGFTTHFSNIGDRQTKIEKQMTVQNNSLQHLTRTIETLSHYITGQHTYPIHPMIINSPSYTPTKG